MSAILGAAIGAGISALGGLLSSSATNSANASMDAATREWQEKMWNKNNLYNTPLNQRKRLEEAGINPALAFANGNIGVASSAPNAVNHTPVDYSALGSGLSSAGAMVLQASQIKAQNDLTRSQAEAQKLQNQYITAEKIAEIDKLIEEKKKIGADTSYLEWMRDRSMNLYDMESKKAYNDILLSQAQARREAAQAYLFEIDGKLRHLQNVANLKFTDTQIQHLKADIERVVAETGVLSEKKLYQILSNANMLPDVKKALRISERMDSNPNETEILDALGLWLDPVSEAVGTGTSVYNARTGRKASAPRAKVKRERKYDGNGNSLVTEYDYE